MTGKAVELIGIDDDGNFHRLPIIKVEQTPWLVRVYVSADHIKNKPDKIWIDEPIKQLTPRPPR